MRRPHCSLPIYLEGVYKHEGNQLFTQVIEQGKMVLNERRVDLD